MNQERQKEEFVKAIKNDEFAELKLTEGVYLITDHELGYGFEPYLVNEAGYNPEDLNEIMENNDIHDIFNWDNLLIGRQKNIVHIEKTELLI